MWPFSKKPAPPTPAPIETPVDLNQPVTNPALVAAIAALMASDTPATRQQVGAQLNRANFLVPILTDEMDTKPGEVPEQVTVQKDSLLKIMGYTDPNGASLLALFTDWDEIRAWTSEPVSTLVMPSGQAWNFVLSQNYQGAIVNPAGAAVPLGRAMVEAAARELEA